MNFQFCPNCGEKITRPVSPEDKALQRPISFRFECDSCGHIRYHNIAATASMILLCGDELLFSKRGLDPQKGLLDFPGGFVDAYESLEEAFVREMEEELDWTPEQFQYAFSCPNIYDYESVQYHTCDAYYFAQVDEKPDLEGQDDIDTLIWVPISQIDDSVLAFESVRLAIKQLKNALQINE